MTFFSGEYCRLHPHLKARSTQGLVLMRYLLKAYEHTRIVSYIVIAIQLQHLFGYYVFILSGNSYQRLSTSVGTEYNLQTY